jgi:hypothetical protein
MNVLCGNDQSKYITSRKAINSSVLLSFNLGFQQKFISYCSFAPPEFWFKVRHCTRILASPSPLLLRWLAGLAERMIASRPASGLQMEEPEESMTCWDPAMLAGVDASSDQMWIRAVRSRRCGSGRRLPVGDGNERCGLFV